jgi:hypothetical protein
MADFYSAFSACNPCCAAANTDGVSILLCCENKQCPCSKRGRCGKKCRRRGRCSKC